MDLTMVAVRVFICTENICIEVLDSTIVMFYEHNCISAIQEQFTIIIIITIVVVDIIISIIIIIVIIIIKIIFRGPVVVVIIIIIFIMKSFTWTSSPRREINHIYRHLEEQMMAIKRFSG